MAKPLIGITGRRWSAQRLSQFLPRSFDSLHFDLHFTDYPSSIAAAGGLPIELTRDADPEGVVERLDGLVLSGGADVDPARYGAEPDPNLGPLEPDRDVWEFALLDAARARDLPILAICRGAQLVNVAFGGTLRQHVEMDEGSGHPAWDSDARGAVHDIAVQPGTVLATLYPERRGVNSLHHQTIDRLGEKLAAVASADDGVVEAFEVPGEDILAVQWHPELMGGPDPTFSWIVGAATRFMHKQSPH
jgi:putative glutamine amidotransferase